MDQASDTPAFRGLRGGVFVLLVLFAFSSHSYARADETPGSDPSKEKPAKSDSPAIPEEKKAASEEKKDPDAAPNVDVPTEDAPKSDTPNVGTPEEADPDSDDPLAQPLEGAQPIPSGAKSTSSSTDATPSLTGAAPTQLGVIRGQNVNIRVGPRRGPHRVTQLHDGAVVIVVERLEGWLGIRIPVGFPAVAACKYLQPVTEGRVRVNATKLNLRVAVPPRSGVMPSAFRDQPKSGEVMPLIRRKDGWAWVLAPEYIRAYVSDRYVRVLGPVGEHQDQLKIARDNRATYVQMIDKRRMELKAESSGNELRASMGRAQVALSSLRRTATFDQAPVVKLLDELRAALKQHKGAPKSVRRLATALILDLDAEAQLRAARAQAAIEAGPAVDGGALPDPLEPASASGPVTMTGLYRWEPTSSNAGEWVFWQNETPRYVLRPAPLAQVRVQDMRVLQGQQVRVAGTVTKHKIFGLPLVAVGNVSKLPVPVVRKSGK